MPGSWRFLMKADDVFVHPGKWQPISRATAVAIHWRVPVAVSTDGASASWFDELSPYFHGTNSCPLEGLQYYRYLDPPPQSKVLTNLGPSPNTSTEEAEPPAEEQKFWINLVVVDEWGDFVTGVGASVVGPGDAKGGGTSDAQGRIVVSNLKSGKSKVTLGKHLFFTDESKAGKLVKPEEVAHTMKDPESLGGIARKHGTTDGRSIYYYPANAALKGKRAALGLVQAKDEFKVPKTYVFEFPTKPDGEAHEYKLKVPAMLDITKVDAQFASSKEKLDIQYEIALMAKQKVILEISSAHLDGGKPLFKKELDAAQKKDGVHTFQWDGKATEGKIKDKHISPLYTPYKVKLYVDGKAHHTDEREFQVLYDSIKLTQGPWTHDEAIPPEADEKKFVAYHLNRLGYWAGPVGNDFDDYLKISTILYKSNHPKLHKVKFSDYNDTIDATLKAALKAGDRSRTFIKGDGITNPKGTAEIRVELLTYEKDGSEWAEYLTHRPTKMKERRTRPLIPLEVEILLKGKAGKGVSAPGGVGPAHIAWTFKDPPEDTSTQYDVTASEPSRTKKFIDKALKEKGGGPGGDNCPKEYGGIREAAATNYKTPFVLGTKYECWDVKDDSGAKKVYTEAVVDGTKYPKRLGKAGVLFRPSYVAGDAYIVKAELEFRKDTADLPNKADLEKRHGLAANKTIKVSTGTLTIKHFGEIAMVITWPARAGGRELDKVRTEFEKAYVDLTTGHSTKKMTDVLTNDQYGTIVAAETSLTKAQATLSDDTGYARAVPAQGVQNAANYKTLVDTRVITDFWEKANFKGAIREKLTENLRGEHSTLSPKPTFIPRGFVLVETIANKPVDLLKDPATGDNTIVVAGYIAPLSSIGIADSFSIINTQDADKAYYVEAHEMGHNCFLQHWENAGGKHDASHDKKDHNCLLAYPEGSAPTVHLHQKTGSFTPHFCGKCNLKIRGWDNEAAGFPAQS
ncbi:MAG: hypothetical protein IT379_34810 [Deltaproteobacteria bacterium]|nr:hypothetical protein [Deltaproteobacteria bacterium]